MTPGLWSQEAGLGFLALFQKCRLHQACRAGSGLRTNMRPSAWIEAYGRAATIVMQLSDMKEVLDAAVAGPGLAVLPYKLVYRREIGWEAAVRAILRFVSAVVREDPTAIRGGD